MTSTIRQPNGKWRRGCSFSSSSSTSSTGRRRGFLAGFSFLGFGGFAAFGGSFWFSFGISCSGSSKPFTSVCALSGAWLCTGWAAGCSGFVRLILIGDS